MGEVNVTISFDDNYCKHAASLIFSILDNASKEDFYNLYIFYSEENLSKESREKLKKLFKDYNCKLIFKEVKGKEIKFSSLFKKYLSKIGSIATLYRLISFNKIPKKRIVYLDIDVIVKDDLKKLYNQTLEQKTVGAIDEYIIGLSKEREYFNAGILLVDLEKWRKNNYTKKCLELIKKKKGDFLHGDQGVLNEVFENKWKHLPLRFNRQKILFEYSPKDLGISKERYKELLKNPAIIHYTGPIKPWHFKYVFPDKKDYIKNLDKTSWKGEINKDFSLKTLIFYILRWIVYKLKLRKFLEKNNLALLSKKLR